jgi:hypothetical protein
MAMSYTALTRRDIQRLMLEEMMFYRPQEAAVVLRSVSGQSRIRSSSSSGGGISAGGSGSSSSSGYAGGGMDAKSNSIGLSHSSSNDDRESKFHHISGAVDAKYESINHSPLMGSRHAGHADAKNASASAGEQSYRIEDCYHI